MKKLAIILVAAVLALGMSNIVMAQNYEDHTISSWNDGDGIAGSTHDFSDLDSSSSTLGEAWNTTGELCRVCHVPHDDGESVVRYAAGLLWNHDLSAVVSYALYTSPSFDGGINQPAGISRLCLGCHDGTVALDAFGQYVDGTSGNEMGGSNMLELADFVIPNPNSGTANDMRGTHPISMDFSGTELNGLTDLVVGGDGTYPIADILFNDKVECASCHDVHNQESIPGTHLLRVDNDGSGLCLTCHIK